MNKAKFNNHPAWPEVELEDIAEIVIGGTPARKTEEYWDVNKVTNNYWLSIRDINQKYIYETSERITDLGIEKSNVKLIPINTVMMSFKLSIGRVAINKVELYTNEAIASFFPIDKNLFINEFLYYALQRINYSKSTDVAVKGMTLNKAKLKKLKLLLPSLIEQQKIASILSSVDEAIEKTQEIVKQTSKIRKGILRELLTKGISHTKFKDTPVGRAPINWSNKKLSEVTEIINGGTPSKSNNEYWENGDIPWATPTDITKQKSKYIKETKSNINNLGLGNSSATLLPVGTILMTSRATIGERSINTVPMATNQGFKSFICKEDELLNEFLYYLIEILKERFKSLSSGSTFLEISKSEIESFLIQVPPINEQREICERINSLDKKIEVEQQKIVELSKIKNSFMQQLLTGKVRVQINENEEVPL